MIVKKSGYYSKAYKRNVPGTLEKLKNVVVGIAGTGGLGSNIANSLIRCGINKFILADYDRVEISNLNRQQFFLDQVGKSKVLSLKENLLRINPYAEIRIFKEKINKDNVSQIFGECDILLEAFDDANSKVMLIETWLSNHPNKYIVSGSGIAGYGNFSDLHIARHDMLIICGDEKSSSELGLMAPRIMIVANMQANEALKILIDKNSHN